MDIIKVSGTSRTSAVAGAIAGVFRENKRAEIQAIGAGAVNQAVKAVILARGYLGEDGYDIVFFPEFVDVEIEDKVRTAIKISVELRYPESADSVLSTESDESAEPDEAVDSDEATEYTESDEAVDSDEATEYTESDEATEPDEATEYTESDE